MKRVVALAHRAYRAPGRQRFAGEGMGELLAGPERPGSSQPGPLSEPFFTGTSCRLTFRSARAAT